MQIRFSIYCRPSLKIDGAIIALKGGQSTGMRPQKHIQNRVWKDLEIAERKGIFFSFRMKAAQFAETLCRVFRSHPYGYSIPSSGRNDLRARPESPGFIFRRQTSRILSGHAGCRPAYSFPALTALPPAEFSADQSFRPGRKCNPSCPPHR